MNIKSALISCLHVRKEEKVERMEGNRKDLEFVVDFGGEYARTTKPLQLSKHLQITRGKNLIRCQVWGLKRWSHCCWIGLYLKLFLLSLEIQSKIQSRSIYTIMLIDLIFTVHFYNNCVALSTIRHIVSMHHSIFLYLLYEICFMFFTFTLPYWKYLWCEILYTIFPQIKTESIKSQAFGAWLTLTNTSWRKNVWRNFHLPSFSLAPKCLM